MWLTNKFQKLNMQKKLMLSFSIPIILIVGIIILVAFPSVNSRYQEKTIYTAYQNVEQATSYLNEHFQNMMHTADMVTTNDQITEILFAEAFVEEKTSWESLQEFKTLKKQIENLENEASGYSIQLYLPDEVDYTINHEYIFPVSELIRDVSEKKIIRFYDYNSNFFAVDSANDRLVLFRRVLNTTTQNESMVKVSLSINNIEKILNNVSIIEGGMAFLLGEEREVLVSTGNTDSWDKISFSVTEDGVLQKIDIDGTKYYAMESGSTTMNGCTVLLMMPYNEMNEELYLFTYYFFLILACIIVVIIVFSAILSHYFVKKITDLSDRIAQLRGSADNKSGDGYLIGNRDELDQIYIEFEDMEKNLRQVMLDQYKLGKQVKTFELKALQAQINPHFLYNTLDLINWMAMDFGAEEISDLAVNLARYYRISLNKGKSILLIGEEIVHVKYYLDIENYHFSNAIHLHTNVEEGIEELACPNIVLQPFVENAIMHGIAKYPDISECNIWIDITREDNDILFVVKDDGPGMDEVELAQLLPSETQKVGNKGYGVSNVHFRLKLFFGEKYGLRYESCPGCGTIVYIRIPALSKEEMEKVII